MTTLAIDKHGTVAADGLRTWGDDIVALDHEKLRVRYGRIYALTGLSGAFEPLIKWHGGDGADPEKLPKNLGGPNDGGWTLIVIEQPGFVTKYTHTLPYPETLTPPVAFGAGIDLAKGAMLFGATAKQAVQMVAENTVSTGGRIQVFDIAAVLGPQKLEAAE